MSDGFEPSALVIGLLTLAGFCAGLVDAIAGGGGIITVPSLLAAGLDPRAALATNKGQAIFGSSASLVAFARHGQVDKRRAPWSFVAAAIGALLGARAVLLLRPEVLRPFVLVLLCVAAGAAFIRKPQGTPQGTPHGTADPDAPPRGSLAVAVVVALVLGAYDGFFGPGTGTFLVLSYAYLFGDPLVRASGNAKVANFASNLASFTLFALSGAILWRVALPMGVAQALGATLGARLAVRKGAGLVRGAAVAISLALAARVLWQMVG